MKKALSFLLVLCLMLTATPLCVAATDSDSITLSADIERILYCPGDTVSVNIDLSNNASGIAIFRGKLYYDSENLTLSEVICNAPADSKNDSKLSVTTSEHQDYVQILWSVVSGNNNIANYFESGTIATVTFTVNEKAENKKYDFDFEYIDGVHYIFGENFSNTTWEFVTNVNEVSDSMTVDTTIPTQLYFENVPTGAYAGDSVTLQVAVSGNVGMYIFNSKLHFDADSYTVTECVSADNSLNLSYNVKDGYINLLWDNNDGSKNFTGDTVVASVTFAVKPDAVAGTSKFELEYIDAVSIDLSAGVSVTNTFFNAFSCEFPLLTEKMDPVNIILNRGNGVQETIERYPGENLVLPDTNFVDKTWYTDPAASIDSIYSETVCPSEEIELYSSAGAVDYNGEDYTVPYRYSQDLSVVKEDDTETLYFDSTASDEINSMFRLSKVEDNVTYKLTVKYKASVETEIGFGVAGATGDNMCQNTSYFEGNAETAVYSITESTDGYNTADIYFTASLKGEVDNQSASDDIKLTNGNDWAYLTLIDTANSGSNEIWISELTLTKIGEVFSVGGASLLNEYGYIAAENMQAIRYYFGYDTVIAENDDGEQVLNIVIGDNNYEIVARGFLYRNGAVNKYTNNHSVTKEGMTYTAALSSSEIKHQIKTEDFNTCWTYNNETGELCFSTYVDGYTEEMYDLKLMVRGFVTFRDKAGNEFTVYSSTINRSVNGMKNNPLSGIDVL